MVDTLQGWTTHANCVMRELVACLQSRDSFTSDKGVNEVLKQSAVPNMIFS